MGRGVNSEENAALPTRRGGHALSKGRGQRGAPSYLQALKALEGLDRAGIRQAAEKLSSERTAAELKSLESRLWANGQKEQALVIGSYRLVKAFPASLVEVNGKTAYLPGQLIENATNAREFPLVAKPEVALDESHAEQYKQENPESFYIDQAFEKHLRKALVQRLLESPELDQEILEKGLKDFKQKYQSLSDKEYAAIADKLVTEIDPTDARFGIEEAKTSLKSSYGASEHAAIDDFLGGKTVALDDEDRLGLAKLLAGNRAVSKELPSLLVSSYERRRRIEASADNGAGYLSQFDSVRSRDTVRHPAIDNTKIVWSSAPLVKRSGAEYSGHIGMRQAGGQTEYVAFCTYGKQDGEQYVEKYAGDNLDLAMKAVNKQLKSKMNQKDNSQYFRAGSGKTEVDGTEFDKIFFKLKQ